MKRLAGWLLALVMLVTAAGGFAETAPDLYDLYESTAAGEQWLATAVPVLDGVLIASAAALPEGVKSLKVWNGTEYLYATMAIPAAGGSLLVVLYDMEGKQPSVPYYPFADLPETPASGTLMVRSGDRMRSRINRAVYDAATITWQGMDCLTVTLSGDTALGSPLLTADGELAGIIAAEYGEGVNRYVAVKVIEIAKILENAAAELYGESFADNRPEGYKVTLDKNVVTFDWTDVELPEVPEGQSLYHIVADADSDYLTYNVVKPGGTKSVAMLLTPGRTYVSGLVAAAGDGPSELPEKYAVTELPEAEPLTEYSFRSVAFAVAEMPENAPQDAMPVPVEKVTEELLRSGRGCIYSLSAYNVDRTMDSVPMLIALTVPDGSNYRYESGWYYDASLTDSDEWYVPLADTGLLEMLDETGYPEGTYELAMYIDGKLADSCTFELTK